MYLIEPPFLAAIAGCGPAAIAGSECKLRSSMMDYCQKLAGDIRYIESNSLNP